MAIFKNFHGFYLDLTQVICIEPVGNFQIVSDASWKMGFKVHLSGGNFISIIKPRPAKDLYVEADYVIASNLLRDEFIQVLKDNGVASD